MRCTMKGTRNDMRVSSGFNVETAPIGTVVPVIKAASNGMAPYTPLPAQVVPARAPAAEAGRIEVRAAEFLARADRIKAQASQGGHVDRPQ